MVSVPSYESTGSGLNPGLGSQWTAHPDVHPPFWTGRWTGSQGNLLKANCANTAVTLAVSWENGFWPAIGSRANEMEMRTEATHSYSICPNLTSIIACPLFLPHSLQPPSCRVSLPSPTHLHSLTHEATQRWQDFFTRWCPKCSSSIPEYGKNMNKCRIMYCHFFDTMDYSTLSCISVEFNSNWGPSGQWSFQQAILPLVNWVINGYITVSKLR